MENNVLKEFVLDYFSMNNAKVLESKKHITIQVPKKIAEKLNCESVLNITFDKQYAEKNEDIEFIAKGSALLNKIINVMEKRGLTTIKYYKGKEFTGLEMNFKVTFESINKKEKVFSFLVELKSNKIEKDLLTELSKKQFEEGEAVHIEQSKIEEIYDLCIKEIKKEISIEMQEIKSKLKNALEKEKNIIEKFYDGIIADLRKKQENKIKTWKEKKAKAYDGRYTETRQKYRKEAEDYEEKIHEQQEKSFEELNNYFQIKQKRFDEIENQYQLKTKVLLYSSALVVIK